MTRAARGSWRVLRLAALCAWSCAACASEGREPEVGGDTHWLAACDDDGECGRGSCTCGLCTESCDGDAQCAGDRPARCYETASPGVRAACESGRAPQADTVAICLAQCGADRECDSDQLCVGGACVQRGEPSAQLDAGATASGLPATRASAFAELEPSVSFDEPEAAFPEPERDFVGAAEPLLGTWTDPACDPADGGSWTYSPGGCVSLVIERSSAGGAIRGQLRVRNEIDVTPWQLNWQTFAPASDPEIGYPVEVGPEHYLQIGLGPSFGPYTLLDPFFDGTRLRFWLAPMELWDGWCRLQQSHHVPGSDPAYQCVPEGAAYGDPQVDFGKLVLCTSEWSAGSCELECDPANDVCPEPVTVGCSCRTPDGYSLDDTRPECSPANCRCDQDGCEANWYQNRFDLEATWDGETITVRDGWGLARPGAAMATLVREPAP